MITASNKGKYILFYRSLMKQDNSFNKLCLSFDYAICRNEFMMIVHHQMSISNNADSFHSIQKRVYSAILFQFILAC